MHMVWEGGQPRIVPGIIPTVTGLSTRGLPVVAILLPGNLTTASPSICTYWAKKVCGAIDKIDEIEIRYIDVLFIELDLLTCHHRGGCKAAGPSHSTLVRSCEVRQDGVFPAPELFPLGGRRQSNHSGWSPRAPASKRSRNVSVLIP